MGKYIDIHFRLADRKEKEAIEQAAFAAGKTVSEYAREILLAASDYQWTAPPGVQGKPLRQPGGRKGKDMHIRFSEEELAYYLKQAEQAGCSVSEYIRRSANGNRVYVIPGMKELAKQIAKLGVNINQLTVLAHQGKIREVDLFACNDTLKQILRQLVQLTKQKKG